MGTQADVVVYLVADGRIIGWQEAEYLEDGKVLEVACRKNGVGRRRIKKNEGKGK